MFNKGILTIIYRERGNFFKECEYKLDFKNNSSTLNSVTSQSSILDMNNGDIKKIIDNCIKSLNIIESEDKSYYDYQ